MEDNTYGKCDIKCDLCRKMDWDFTYMIDESIKHEMRGGGDDKKTYSKKEKAIGHVLTIIALGAANGLAVGAIVGTIWYLGYSHAIQDAWKVYQIGKSGCHESGTMRAVMSYFTNAPSCGDVQKAYDVVIQNMMGTLSQITKGIFGVTGLSSYAIYWAIHEKIMNQFFSSEEECEIPQKDIPQKKKKGGGKHENVNRRTHRNSRNKSRSKARSKARSKSRKARSKSRKARSKSRKSNNSKSRRRTRRKSYSKSYSKSRKSRSKSRKIKHSRRKRTSSHSK